MIQIIINQDEYKFIRFNCVGGQRLDDSLLEPDKLILEGKIAQRLECRPYGT